MVGVIHIYTMRIIPTFKKCNRCLVDLQIDDFYYNESIDKYESTCRDCKAKRYNKTDRRKKKNQIVKESWLNSKIKINGKIFLTNKITENDVEMIINEGYGFILRNFEKKGTSVL
jgi:DNA polymerase III delta prime subunit